MYEKIDAIKYSPIYQELLKHENSVTRYALRLKQEKKISDDDYFREIEVAGKIVADVTEHMKDVFSRYYEGTTDEDKKEWVYSNIRAAHNKLDALYPAIDQLESRQVSANKKNTLIMFGAGAIVIFILTAFFVPALRIPALTHGLHTDSSQPTRTYPPMLLPFMKRKLREIVKMLWVAASYLVSLGQLFSWLAYF
jgi:hypothetical protein